MTSPESDDRVETAAGAAKVDAEEGIAFVYARRALWVTGEAPMPPSPWSTVEGRLPEPGVQPESKNDGRCRRAAVSPDERERRQAPESSRKPRRGQETACAGERP